MHVAAGRNVRCIEIRVRIEPHQAELSSMPAKTLRHSRNRADRNGMVAAQYEWRPAVLVDFKNQVREVPAGVGDFLQVLRFGIAEVMSFRNDHVEVAQVLHVVTEALQLFIQVRVAQRGRSHIDTTPVGSEIHGHAYNRHFQHTYIVPSGREAIQSRIMDYKARTKVSRILIDEAVPVGGNVIILGWVRTVRSSKEVAFVEVNDGSCMKNIQGVIQQPESFPVLEQVLTGASVRLEGRLVTSGGKGQKYEVAVSRIDLIGYADASYPLQKKRHTNEFLREIAHLRPRTNTFGAVNRIRSKMAYAVHTYYQERGFYYVHTPIISASDCEGAGNLFRVSSFDFQNIPKK